MPRQQLTFQQLVTQVLPLSRLSSASRQAVQKALASGVPAELEAAALAAMHELAQTGVLPADSAGLPAGQVRYHLPGGSTVVVITGSPRTAAGPRRLEPSRAWTQAAPPEALHALIRLHEELLTGDRSSLRSPKELVRTLLGHARRILPVDDLRWVQLPEWSAAQDWDASWMHRPADPAEVEDVFAKGRIVYWNDLAADGGPHSPEGHQSMAAVRVGKPGDDWASVLEAWSSERGHFTESRLNLLQIIADEVALLLSQLLTLQRFVFLDALTGLYNRAYYEMQMRREIERAKRDREPMALLLCDVDNFKQFNTKYGYAGGDAVLRGVASILQKTVRPFDVVARYGGEEFVIILTAPVVRQDARTVAERVRQAVSAARFEVTDLDRMRQQVSVTVSVGVALFPEDAQGESELWNKANTSVLQAKASGKDRVIFWGESALQ